MCSRKKFRALRAHPFRARQSPPDPSGQRGKSLCLPAIDLGPQLSKPMNNNNQQSNNNAPHSQPSTFNSQLIYSYTRSQAIADGFQIDVSKIAAEAGIRFPVFITRGVYEKCVAVPSGVTGQDEAGRLWDVVWMLRFAIIRSQPGTSRLSFALYVRNSNSHARLTKLIATAGAVDIDDPAPAITVMLPDED